MHVGLKLTLETSWNACVIYSWVHNYVSWMTDSYMVIGSYISAVYYQNYVCSISLGSNRSVCFTVHIPSNLWRQHPAIIYTSLHNQNLFPRWKPFQISYCSNQVQGLFLLLARILFHTFPDLTDSKLINTLFLKFSTHIWSSSFISFQLQYRLTSCNMGSQLCLLNKQLVL